MHLYLPEEVVTFYREENATNKKTLKKKLRRPSCMCQKRWSHATARESHRLPTNKQKTLF